MRTENENILCEQVVQDVELRYMDEMLIKFSDMDRLTGSSQAEEAVDYIISRLQAMGIACKKYTFDAYLSNPIKSDVKITNGDHEYSIETRPRSFSRNCPQGVRGELIYDSCSPGNVHSLEAVEFYKGVKDKIVITYNYNEDYAKMLERYGAVGIIQVWTTNEDVIHEDTVSPVWGAVTIDREYFLPGIPVVGTKKSMGEKVLAELKEHKLKAVLCSEVQTDVFAVSLPVAEITGKSDDFVLLSGHYDSWYYGVTDNGTGNAACFELARIFEKYKDKMERSLKIAWWPAHSNGRYTGSSWFCDNFWDDLYEHCYAQINVDSPGCRGAEVVLPRTTGFEGKDFMDEFIKEFTGVYPRERFEMCRGADQSFWGPCIPYHIMPKYEQKPENKIYASAGSGGGWWWHASEDTYDKVDKDILLRDTIMLAAMAGRFVFSQVLPYDLNYYFDKIHYTLSCVDANSDEEFDFNDIYLYIGLLRRKAEEVLNNGNPSPGKANRIIKILGGEMNRLMNSYSGRYEYDNACTQKAFPYISRVSGIYKSQCDTKDFLFLKTDFIRQKNRLITEIKKIIQEIDFVVRSA